MWIKYALTVAVTTAVMAMILLACSHVSQNALLQKLIQQRTCRNVC